MIFSELASTTSLNVRYIVPESRSSWNEVSNGGVTSAEREDTCSAASTSMGTTMFLE